jgi:hypothetical protein
MPLRLAGHVSRLLAHRVHAFTVTGFRFGTRMKRRAKRTMFGIVVGRSSRLS